MGSLGEWEKFFRKENDSTRTFIGKMKRAHESQAVCYLQLTMEL